MTDEKRDPVTGEHLKEWGHRPGKQFPALLAKANGLRAEGFGLVRIRQELEGDIPPKPETLDLRATGEITFFENIDIAHPDEEDNVDKVRQLFSRLLDGEMPASQLHALVHK